VIHVTAFPRLSCPLKDESRNKPDSLELSGKTELLIFALTFLTSTWYIKNPFLKSKINEVSLIGYLQLWMATNFFTRHYSTVFGCNPAIVKA
jgi:hypothetical protein